MLQPVLFASLSSVRLPSMPLQLPPPSQHSSFYFSRQCRL
uniref:Uncharacterized protein n=1 Tax=Rhizophora mucronata TaxID=61149 RepID=A0A2P2PF25_RHIMU